MPLTPADIHNVSFRKSSIGKRGYDEEEVDGLLDAVTQQMIQLLEENDMMRDHIRRTDAVDATGESPSADAPSRIDVEAVTGELDRARFDFSRAAQHAQALRDRLDAARRAESEGDVPAPAADTSGRTDRVLSMAQHTADQHLQGAIEESQQLLGAARDESAQITRQAQTTARDITAASGRRDSESTASLAERRTALLKEIEELTEFAEHYRTALTDQVRRQVQL